MKNGQILLFLSFSGAVFFGCQKETSLSENLPTNSQPYVKTVLRFTAGDKTFELSSVRQETGYGTNSGCAGNGCGNGIADDYETDWTTYSTGNIFTIIRQDDAGRPAFRLSLSGNIDLKSGALPVNVANAHIVLNDFNGVLVQPTDDPAYSTGALSFEGTQDAVHLTVTSRSGNVVEGTFGGTLKMANGSTLDIRDGTFTAQLRGL